MSRSTVVPREQAPVPAAPPPDATARVPNRSAVAAGRAAGSGLVNLAVPHDPALCAGRGCSRHHPSDHHMRAWPKVWREYYGFHDRMCSHGVGHPDPDDVVSLQSVGGASAAHPCDGCCIAPLKDVP